MIIYSVILDFNNSVDTYLAYQSLLSQQLNSNIEHRIIIIDNGSQLNNQKENIDNFKQEKFTILNNMNILNYKKSSSTNLLIVLDSNLGFTGGNNIALKIAMDLAANYILLFNNDATAEETVVQKLIDYSNNNAITGGAIYDYKNRRSIQTLGTYRFGWKGYSTVPKTLISKEKIKVASVSGACMLFPAKILNEIGFFDNNFYLYSEENELSKRAKLSGYDSYTISDAKVYHKGSATLGNESNLKFYYLIRNNLYFHKKYSSNIHYILIIAYQVSVNIIKNFSNTSRLKTLFIAVSDGINGNMGKCKRIFK